MKRWKTSRENNNIWIIGVLKEENQNKETEQILKSIIQETLAGKKMSS